MSNAGLDENGETPLLKNDTEKNTKTNKLQLSYNVIREAYNFTFQNRTSLDEKASKIIIFSGIIMSAYSGIGSLFLKDLSKSENLVINKYGFLLMVLFLGILSLFISIILALKAYKPEIWKNVPLAKPFHEKYVINDEDEELILSKLAASTVEAITGNEANMRNKAKNIKKAYIALQIGVFLCALFMFSALII